MYIVTVWLSERKQALTVNASGVAKKGGSKLSIWHGMYSTSYNVPVNKCCSFLKPRKSLFSYFPTSK